MGQSEILREHQRYIASERRWMRVFKWFLIALGTFSALMIVGLGIFIARVELGYEARPTPLMQRAEGR